MIRIVEFRLLGLIMIPCIFNSIMFGQLRFHHGLPNFQFTFHASGFLVQLSRRPVLIRSRICIFNSIMLRIVEFRLLGLFMIPSRKKLDLSYIICRSVIKSITPIRRQHFYPITTAPRPGLAPAHNFAITTEAGLACGRCILYALPI